LSLDGKVVLISGANGGLGSAVTRAFLDAGAQVAGLAPVIRDTDFPSPRFAAVPADLTSLEASRTAAGAVLAKWGRIDALIHLVGGFAGGKSVAETGDDWLELMLNMNLRTAFNLMRAVLPGMRTQGSGRIVAIGSRTAVEPAAMLGVYSASKAALVSLVRTVALENKDRGITANVVLPGAMDTPANRAAMPDADRSKWVQPSQVAALLVHLASDQASQITGAAIPIVGADL
jgi:NAD(P)-dependent dehydrogenase (short-subunit alcohol dehydrogenase family)